jgi:hypothetical protein
MPLQSTTETAHKLVPAKFPSSLVTHLCIVARLLASGVCVEAAAHVLNLNLQVLHGARLQATVENTTAVAGCRFRCRIPFSM